MTDCVFCGIVGERVESSRVYADERVVAFLDIRPVSEGHTLVVPRAHGAHLAEIAPDDGAAMFRAAMKVDAGLRRSGLPCEGVTLWLADGEAAGQDVFHAHLHVIPRFAGDGFGLRLPPDYHERQRAELNETAQQIRSVL